MLLSVLNNSLTKAMALSFIDLNRTSSLKTLTLSIVAKILPIHSSVDSWVHYVVQAEVAHSFSQPIVHCQTN